MVQNGGSLGHPDRIVGAHHVTHLADMDIFGNRRPIAVEYAGVGTDFVTFGMKMMLDRRHPPHAHLVGGFDDLVPAAQHFLVKLAVARDRPFGGALGFVARRYHRIKLQNDLEHTVLRSLAYRLNARSGSIKAIGRPLSRRPAYFAGQKVTL